ncbi:hypothetical protein KCU81_g483, partial [Aureobasidium melanogenum]
MAALNAVDTSSDEASRAWKRPPDLTRQQKNKDGEHPSSNLVPQRGHSQESVEDGIPGLFGEMLDFNRTKGAIEETLKTVDEAAGGDQSEVGRRWPNRNWAAGGKPSVEHRLPPAQTFQHRQRASLCLQPERNEANIRCRTSSQVRCVCAHTSPESHNGRHAARAFRISRPDSQTWHCIFESSAHGKPASSFGKQGT